MALEEAALRPPPALRTSRLRLERLESRDVPAFFDVKLVSPGVGIPGDSEAAHIGELTQNVSYPSTSTGGVVVSADTPAQAVSKAISGRITVSTPNLPGGSVSHIFVPGMVITDSVMLPNEIRPFYVNMSGTQGQILLEELAGTGLSDFDYNDRSWTVNVTPVDTAWRLSAPTRVSTNSDATLTGDLSLNTAFGSDPTGVTVVAPTLVEAIQLGLMGTVTASFSGQTNNVNYVFNAEHSSGVEANHKAYWIELTAENTAIVHLEDLAFFSNTDWDYNDRTWSLTATPTYSPASGSTIEFLQADRTPTNGLKVSRWDGAFENTTNGIKPKAGFIHNENEGVATEKERYKIRLSYLNGFTNSNAAFRSNNTVDTLTVHVKSESAGHVQNDQGSTLTLHETGANSAVFESDWLLLTARALDDEYSYRVTAAQANGIADGQPNDRTLRVRLGDLVKVSYTGQPGANTSITAYAPVPVKKYVRINPTVMTNQGVDVGYAIPDPDNVPANGYATVVEVQEWIRNANEILAQVGIELFSGPVRFADQPLTEVNDPGGIHHVNLENGLQSFDPTLGSASATYEEMALIRGKYGDGTPIRTPATDDIDLFVINKFGGGLIGGEAFTKKSAPTSNLINTVIIGAEWIRKEAGYAVIAHEVAHILLDEGGHYETTNPNASDVLKAVNLLSDGWAKEYADRVSAPIRLSSAQRDDIFTKRPELLKDDPDGPETSGGV